MKRERKVVSGLLFVAFAILIVFGGLERVPTVGGIEMKIAVGVLMMLLAAFAIIYKKKYSLLWYPAAGIFCIFEEMIALRLGDIDGNILNDWLVFLAATFLAIGTRLIVGKTPDNRTGASSKKNMNSNENGDHANHVEGNLSNSVRYIDASTLGNATIDNNMARLEVFIQNEDSYAGGGVLKIENNLGRLTLHIPPSWRVVERVCENNLGRVDVREAVGEDGDEIFIESENNLGFFEIVSP